MKIELGDKVRDVVTGFEGIATARTEYLNKCVRLQVTPQGLHEGKPIDTSHFDEEQLQLVQRGAVVLPKSEPTGGDRPPTKPVPTTTR